MKVVSVVTAYGQGNFEPLMDRLPGKKAQITEAIDGVRERLRGAAEATSAQLATAAYNARIKSALDNVSANVMIADNDLNIIYMNRTVSEMLGRAEADIRKQLPNFDAGRLMGANIDVFHKNPAHQRHLLANLTGVHKAELNLGGRRFSLDVVPVFNDANERLGSAVQWTDRTEEHRAEQEVSQLVQAAAAGDFSKRVEEAGKEGFFLRLAKDLNSLVDTADRGLRDVSRMLGRWPRATSPSASRPTTRAPSASSRISPTTPHKACRGCSGRFARPPTPSTPPPARSPAATPNCRRAPSSRRRAWRKPPRAWKN